ncbi:MAG TPA: RNA polymerase sigma factor [Candidatus Acidoferrum sp.]|nr:RNA polymerase sigma factor [Candidatus Acidoferrum sp.]
MGTMGLALPWEARISLERVQRGPVEPRETTREVSSVRAPLSRDDLAIAAACQSGDLRAFEELYRLHGARMKSMARNLLGTTSDAEDAVQETFLKIQRSIATFRGQSSFLTWSFRILINTCYDARRSRMRKREVPQDEPDRESAPRPEPRAPLAHPSLKLALERAVEQLTPQQREVFLMYEVEGLRHSEIAGVLEISETASKNTLFQAKKNLRQMLEAPRSSAAEAR